MQIILASSSPRRRTLFEFLESNFTCIEPNVDESRTVGETPKDYVMRLAAMKASSVDAKGALILGADTTVTIGDTVLGKPDDREDATRMLSLLSGRSHHVLTSVAARCDQCYCHVQCAHDDANRQHNRRWDDDCLKARPRQTAPRSLRRWSGGSS